MDIDSVVKQISELDCWKGKPSVDTLDGGMTNQNFVVKDNHSKYVVRLGQDIPEHQILRFNELAASRAAHAAGIAPAVHYVAKGLLVIDYIEGRTLTADDINRPETLERVVKVIKDCHQRVAIELRGASLVFWVFHVIRDYATTLRAANSPYSEQLNEWLELASRLESLAGPFDIVYGHNDLLAANFIDDGKKLWLIDWEYAGYNTPLFDLGGLASNNDLPEALERKLLDLYFSEAPSEQRWLQYRAMKCASLLRETLWSMVSEVHSKIDFDYSQYSRMNLERFHQAIRQIEL